MWFALLDWNTLFAHPTLYSKEKVIRRKKNRKWESIGQLNEHFVRKCLFLFYSLKVVSKCSFDGTNWTKKHHFGYSIKFTLPLSRKPSAENLFYTQKYSVLKCKIPTHAQCCWLISSWKLALFCHTYFWHSYNSLVMQLLLIVMNMENN